MKDMKYFSFYLEMILIAQTFIIAQKDVNHTSKLFYFPNDILSALFQSWNI